MIRVITCIHITIRNCIQKEKFGVVPLVLHLPVGETVSFSRVVDLVDMKLLEWDGEKGEIMRRLPLEGTLLKKAEGERSKLLEQA